MLSGLVLLALIGGAVWFLALRDDEEAAPDLTESQLEDALLTKEDLGDGYTEDSEDDDTDEISPDDLDTSDECKDLIGCFEGDDAANSTAKRKFASGELAERQSFTHEISVPSEDSPDFGVLVDVVDKCAESVSTPVKPLEKCGSPRATALRSATGRSPWTSLSRSPNH